MQTPLRRGRDIERTSVSAQKDQLEPHNPNSNVQSLPARFAQLLDWTALHTIIVSAHPSNQSAWDLNYCDTQHVMESLSFSCLVTASAGLAYEQALKNREIGFTTGLIRYLASTVQRYRLLQCDDDSPEHDRIVARWRPTQSMRSNTR